MESLRRKILTILSCIVVSGSLLSAAAAENWPTRPITLIVPFGAASATDLVGRIIAAPVSETLGQPVVVQNVGGAAGLIGVSRAANADPDGYTVVMGGVDTFAQSVWLRANPPYDPVKDFKPVGLAVVQPLILIVRKDFPASNLKEFAAYLKKNQAKLQFGSSGVGSATHLVCSQLNEKIGAKVTHISYRGSGEAMQDLLAGNIHYYCAIAVSALSVMKAGTAKSIAILTEERSPILPELATAKEQGYDVGDNYYWMGFFVPKGTPDDIVAKLHAAIAKALDLPSVQARLRDLAATVVTPQRRSTAYLQSFLNGEIKKWGEIIKAAGITPN
jgi:tripartite-type tricarboxylate transporter receptor subunit TctC